MEPTAKKTYAITNHEWTGESRGSSFDAPFLDYVSINGPRGMRVYPDQTPAIGVPQAAHLPASSRVVRT